MKIIRERGRKECPVCGAHRIMLTPADNTCPVCGNSLASVPSFRKKCGNIMNSIRHAHFTGESHVLKAACK